MKVRFGFYSSFTCDQSDGGPNSNPGEIWTKINLRTDGYFEQFGY